jgi:CRISPR-associated exonuclease Cas4
VVIVRGLALRSLRLGLVGRADVVELHQDDTGVPVPGLAGAWLLFPVEYKRGKPKPDRCDEVQLCAQGLCLEEMLGATVTEGALFYGARKRRHPVTLDDSLRVATEQAVIRLHEMLDQGSTPPAKRQKKCRSCSLEEICLPRVAGSQRSVRGWLQRMSRQELHLQDDKNGASQP